VSKARLIRREPNKEIGAPVSDGTDLAAVHAGIADYYTGKIRKFGATPLGVDWTCVPTQQMRFVQLLKLCDFTSPFSLNDLGCGYGALLSYLDWRHAGSAIDYLGVDLSQAMLRRARRLWRDRANVSFVRGHASPRLADYSVASGIFNVQLDQPRQLWERLVAATLDQLHRTSRRGFSLNFMSAPPAGTPERQGVYSTVPERWVRHCADQFGAATEVIDGYGLREFTLIVRRRPVST
jgi:SAM-dependent methyltransferase